MAIGNIADREQGSSVRTKLNLVIDDVNSLAPISGLARTDAAQTFTNTVTVQGAFTAESALTVQGAFTSLGIDDNATAEVLQLSDSLISSTVSFSCTGFASNGIDDNATAERLQISDTELTLGASGANYGIINAVNDQSTVISGGNAEAAGGSVTFFGGAHATQANDIELRGGATLQAFYDDSASSWDFQANALITTGALTCGAFTSTGIDDNATAEKLEITDSFVTIGVDGSAPILVVSASDGVNEGGEIDLHGAAANSDWIMDVGASDLRLFTNDAINQSVKIFNAGSGTTQLGLNQSTADRGFIDFVATIDADATSAISSLTTSGVVTHHIQFEINGTTFWIAGSTTDPS